VTSGITSTVTTNSYDAANQLNTSSASINGGSLALTTYSYDANGNHLGSASAGAYAANSASTRVTGVGAICRKLATAMLTA
jgi:hypothetical protein